MLNSNIGKFKLKKSAPLARTDCDIKVQSLLLGEALVKLLNLAGGGAESCFACVEAMRSRSYLKLDYRISLPFKLGGYGAVHSAARKELVASLAVLKYDVPILGMNVGSHCLV